MGVLLSLLFSAQMSVAEPTITSLILPDGSTIQVELARTSKEHALGLMDRSRLPLDHGMLFIFEQEDLHYFWMKNTFILLDIIWLDSKKNIIYIQENTPPCRADPCPTYGPSMKSLYVLEMNAGIAQRHGLKIGITLKF